ncbi:serine hydrolase [Robinsoniella peoriensis]
MKIDMIDESMENYITNGEMAGAVLYVHHNGTPIYQGQWGSADVQGKVPIGYDTTIFRMASLSKVITAVGIMKLIEQGKLGLDDKVSAVLPEFASPRVVDDERFEGMEAFQKYFILKEPAPLDHVKTVPADRELTVRDLLTHSSGLEMGAYGILSRCAAAKKEDTLKERVRQFAGFALDFQPGSATGYSATGNFDVLARMIEVITGMEFYEFMKREIFIPLDMKDTTYQLSKDQEARLSDLYKNVEGNPTNVSGSREDLWEIGSIGPKMQSGSAGVLCTAQDFDHLTQMLANEGYFKGKQVLKPETVKMLYTETAYEHLEPEPGMEWGLGVKIRRDSEKAGSFATEGSYGWSGAFGTHMVISPRDGLSLTFIMNRADIGGSGSYISKKVEELVFGIFKDYLEITPETRLSEINCATVFSEAKGHFIGGGEAFFEGEAGQMTLSQLQQKNPTWNCGDMIYGLERLQQVAWGHNQYLYPVYPEEAVQQNPELGQVCLFYLPSPKKKPAPYVILLAGGAYGAVCTMVETLPVAAKLNELGINCFCLNYRTVKQEIFQQGLMPKPLDDLAAAWQFIKKHQVEFGVEPEDYIVGGFSAGGHTAAMWGTGHLGYRKYDIPSPRLLMLVYPLITMDCIENGLTKDFMLTGMLGADRISETEHDYEVDRHIDASYPIVYLVQSMDDDTVPPESAERMEAALDRAGIVCQIEWLESGGHGFGLGSETSGKGWVERAVEFLER